MVRRMMVAWLVSSSSSSSEASVFSSSSSASEAAVNVHVWSAVRYQHLFSYLTSHPCHRAKDGNDSSYWDRSFLGFLQRSAVSAQSVS